MSRRKELNGDKGLTRNLKFSPEVKEIFLDIFIKTRSIAQAAAACGVSRTTVYNHLEEDTQFQELMKTAEKDVLYELEAEAHRRAKGYKRAVYFQGKIVGYELVYSDKLLEMLLRARDPRYRNNSTLEVKGSVDVNVNNAKQKLLDQIKKRGITLEHEPEEADFEEIKEDGDTNEQM